MDLEKLENDLIEIISNGVKKIESFELKDDNSVVTSCDIQIEKNIITYLKTNFSDIEVISEENPTNHKKSYNLKNKFAVIDPIDGTENFLFLGNVYGSAVSIVYDSLKYHLIYIPSENKKISTLSSETNKTTNSKINLFSTSCLNQIFDKQDKQSCRIFGSSTFMFYTLLSGNAKSYKYCIGAKIWDYYTGVSLALNSNLELKVKLDGEYLNEIPTNINHRSKFEIINHGIK
jgi:3'-phosphoadenosine 5'-phosphosulfate (PAPS) 3'-phosphatase